MTTPSLSSQIASVRALAQYVGRAPPKMRPSEIQQHEANLRAALVTLETIAERQRAQRRPQPW